MAPAGRVLELGFLMSLIHTRYHAADPLLCEGRIGKFGKKGGSPGPFCLLYLSESGRADVVTAGRFARKVSLGTGGTGHEFCSNTWPKNIKQEHNGEHQKKQNTSTTASTRKSKQGASKFVLRKK